MADPFIAEMRIVGFTFPPKGWATCDGQIIPIAQNVALFSLLGTVYGGDGRTTFALPDLRGRLPVHKGTGPGLSHYDQGQLGGEETHTLTLAELPAHDHGGAPKASGAVGISTSPQSGIPARANANARYANLYSNANGDTLNATALAPTGTAGPHSNLMPFLSVNFIIALQGIFPPRG